MFLCDFHSHIMPGVDHGSSGIETTEKQIEIIKESGVGSVVATPHFYPHMHNIESFVELRRHALEIMLPSLQRHQISLYLGAEVLLCEGMERMDGLSSLCIEGTDVLLLEMPFSRWSDALITSLGRISECGFNVVLAHTDRYPAEYIARLLDFCEVKLQLNAEAFCGIKNRKRHIGALKSGLVYALGSDLHGTKGYGSFTKAIKLLGSENTEKIMNNTKLLLKDARVYGNI